MSESLRLFLVEDNDDIAFVTRLCLERAGHHVTVCHTGADALIVLGHASYDLVLVDYILPDMRGSELLHRLRQDGIHTPALMITAYGDEHLATQVLREGALDYVVRDQQGTYLTELPKRVVESVTRDRLQQVNGLFIAALESTRDAILITDLNGTVLHVNSALESLFGYSRADLIGKDGWELFRSSGDTANAVRDRMWQTLHDRQSWQGELVNERKDGTLLDTSLTLSPIFDGREQMTHFVAIYRDITERKQMERQLVQAQKMQSVGTLAGGVAHEFNNLLAGIQGYASLGLREKNLPPNAREFLEFIVQLTDRAANLTRQMLAFARKPSLVRQPTNLAKLLQTTRDFVQRSLNIEVEVKLDPSTNGEWNALADANQLQQVLVNLTLNARDAMAKPQPAPILYRLRKHAFVGDLPAFPQNVPAGDYLILEVEDRGTGMPSDVLAQALDPFFTTKEVGQGTGLGLPVAFGIMTGHQGYLTIRSEPGQGTCISLYLPRPTERVATPSSGSFTILEPESSPPRHILVVDDESAVRDVIRRFLEIAGHRVTCASGGDDALQCLEPQPVDLVILDWMIPKEDGRSNFDTLRRAKPELPILLCTGVVQSDQAMQLVQDRKVSVLRKPFRMNELWYAVNQALS